MIRHQRLLGVPFKRIHQRAWTATTCPSNDGWISSPPSLLSRLGRASRRERVSWMSSSSPRTSAASPRVGGRQRFYVHVDVVPCPPAWQSSNTLPSVNATTTTTDSPISMGVDGTDSASGVHRRTKTVLQHEQKWLLQPRSPFRREPLIDDDAMNDHDDAQWYNVTLDGRQLRTPAGQILALPSQALAYAIAAEWNAVPSSGGGARIRPAQMPLMTLAATALDQTVTARHEYMAQTLAFLTTDTVCYYVDPVQDQPLYRQQQVAWRDLHEWIVEWSRCHGGGDGAAAATVTGHENGVWLAKNSKNSPNGHLPHPAALVDACHATVQSLDAWHLTALFSMASEAKSFFIALALLLNQQHVLDPNRTSSSSSCWSMNVQTAIQAARVEEEYNIANWGLVEGGHDYDRLNCSVQLHAAAVLKGCLAMDGYYR